MTIHKEALPVVQQINEFFNVLILREHESDNYDYYAVTKFEPPIESSAAPINYISFVGVNITDFVSKNNLSTIQNSSMFKSNLFNHIEANKPLKVWLHNRAKYLYVIS